MRTQFYRAIVDFHRHSKIIVFFCDIGDIDNIDDVKKMKTLPEEFRTLPKLAITAKLYGIKPINSDWEIDFSLKFNQKVSGKRFQAVVGKILDKDNVDDNAILEIRLIDVSKEYDECINDILVKNGRAIPV